MSRADPLHLQHLLGIVDGLRAAAREAARAGDTRLAARLYARMARIEDHEMRAFLRAHGGYEALQRIADQHKPQPPGQPS